MSNKVIQASVIAKQILAITPAPIRETLLNDQRVIGRFDLKHERQITIGSSGTCFNSSIFFDAARDFLSNANFVSVTDTEGREWVLSNAALDGEIPALVLSFDQEQVVLPDLFGLSEDPSLRTRALEIGATKVNLPPSSRAKWKDTLIERALEVDELENYHKDIFNTPVYLEQLIRREMIAGSRTLASLVPSSRTYFDRLVGAYDGSVTIQDYAKGTCQSLFKQLIEWNTCEGLLLSLLVCSHSELTAEISLAALNKEEIDKAFIHLEKYGDMQSRLGAIELGANFLPDRPEMQPLLLNLVKRIRDDNSEGLGSEFKLFSALFTLVDGELARTRLMENEPPFYRRLASLAQASLICRQVIQCKVNLDEFASWAYQNCSETFYMQSLADLRHQPGWSPNLATPPKIKEHFLGRIHTAGRKCRKHLSNKELREAMVGSGVEGVNAARQYSDLLLPSPLDSFHAKSYLSLPSSSVVVIETELSSDPVQAASFRALATAAITFPIETVHAEMAAKAIKLSNYELVNMEGKYELLGILNGLASVAAVSRTPKLAKELSVLVRRYRYNTEFRLSIDEALGIVLVASAAHEDLVAWCGYVGDRFVDLAFGQLEEGEGEVLYSRLESLLSLVPELWEPCSRAEAALQAWILK